MVHDRVIHAAKTHAIERGAGELAREAAEMAHDHILPAAEAEAVFPEHDAFAGSGLPGNGELALITTYRERAFESDQARNGEDNGARTAIGERLGNRVAKTSG